MNDDLFTVSWLLVQFIIIAIFVSSMEGYSFLSALCETMLCMYYFCVLFLFVSSKNMTVGSFLVCLYIFFTLKAFMYTCP